jgi:hypothetical protein
MKTNRMIVTKNEVRNLVDRLSKPKLNKRIEREMSIINQNMPTTEQPLKITPRTTSKPVSISVFHLFFIFM